MTDDTTTIEITHEQRDHLRSMGFGSHKAALQELIDDYNEMDGTLLTDAQRGAVRKIALDVVNDRVVREALE